MSTGQLRREGARDNLAGHQDMEPVILQGPGIAAPAAIRPPDTSYSGRIAQQLGQWSQGKLQAGVNKQRELSIADGQMAHIQGVAVEELEMGGDKWALDAYRVMDAKAISSTMLEAARAEIAKSAYSLSPDDYRAKLTGRLDAMLKDMDDRTGNLVRQQFISHAPTLLREHTRQHFAAKERSAHQSLSRAVDLISRDPTAREDLIAFAQGAPGSPSAGLSDDRRTDAVIRGMVRAFDNDNPNAYAIITEAGVLDPSLTSAQQSAIRAAKSRYEARRRSEFDETLFYGEQELQARVSSGELDPSSAVEELSILYADHEITMTAAEAGAIYSSAQAAHETANQTASLLIEEANLRGDFDTTARLSARVLETPVGAGEWAATIEQYDGNVAMAALAAEFGTERANAYLTGATDPEVAARHAAVQGTLDNWRAPSASDRLAIAREHLNATRERLALDTYEEIAPRLASVDDMFRRGEIDRTAWQGRRESLYATYGQSRSRAIVDHEVRVAREVEEATIAHAQQTQKEGYQIALEQAQAAIVPHRLEWEKVLNNPASTPAEIAQANQQYVAARNSIYEDADIRVVDRGQGSAVEKMLVRTSEAMDRHKQFTEEQVEIDAATAMGYLGELPASLQDRAFRQEEQRTVQHYTNMVAEGRMTEAEANAAIATDMNSFFASAGKVDPRVARRMTAAVMGPLLDKEGNPSPIIADAIAQYAEVKALNPHAAETMLDPEARVRAEAVLSRASDPALIGEAVRTFGIEMENSPLIQDPDEYIGRADVQRAVSREVENYLDTRDIGILHAIWQGDATLDQVNDRRGDAITDLRSDEMRSFIKGELEDEVTRLQRISPNIKPRDLVAHASENLAQRVEVIGGNAIPLPPGKSWGQEFFGARAGDFMHDGAVNSAIMEWMRSPQAQEQYGFIAGNTAAEYLPGWVQAGIGGAVGLIGMEFEPAQSLGSAISTDATGVRPFQAMPIPGGGVAVQVLKPDGNYSEPIVIPMREAGQMYMERRRQELAQ